MLIGVGLGPGSPELLTLKAVETLKKSHKVYVPGRMAAELVAPYAEAEILDFPMLTDYNVLNEVWTKNAELIAEESRHNLVSFGLIGDPNFFSTFTHLKRVMNRLYPDVETATIPGISSITSFASRADAEVDASFEVSDGSEKAYKIVLKATRPLEIIDSMKKEGYNKFTFAQRLFMDDEIIIKELKKIPEKGNYFSIVFGQKE
ncbi:MAG: cobalt-precorrin-2 C(20)-methyltransferase [Methanomethylovorans sp. PtaU1.Bin093]|uniref:cobalt-factor II C(20)-methyltransferase n=1 Tax=Methanomethylovorans sp. PtaU1.Bin093 TaxID=1811679 RepID=UPI0009C44C83|nr:cobalt-factor II C(20)-methyltransferase [Methanomethylovorans sp. PtaU1.Bin093]OPY20499.1 MAG: cobalt-precorrin-2 C(20)-methyltransferase [Methanomethylovorans sp. PtaU1.Bin093]